MGTASDQDRDSGSVHAGESGGTDTAPPRTSPGVRSDQNSGAARIRPWRGGPPCWRLQKRENEDGYRYRCLP
eukprot:5251528-Pyramimonas_sp.AAC.1